MQGHTVRRVQELLGLSRTTILGLIEAGFVSPVRGPRNQLQFSFQDLMLMRTAFALQQASIPPRRILQSLAKLRAELPAEMPLTGLRITAVGARVAVRDRSAQWQAETGQLLMNFEVGELAGSLSFISASDALPPDEAQDWYKRGQELEKTDAQAAEDAYRRAIQSDPSRAAPYVNLGAMWCEAGRCAEAVTLYQDALKAVGHEPLIHFNLAIALEDLDQPDAAVAAYERALDLASAFADAHYNLGLLLERRGDRVGAVRHLNAYRRLQKDGG